MAAIGLSWFIARRVARTAGIDAEPVLTRMLLVGLVAARLAFGWQWRGPYFDAPLSILDIRHGGWNAATGLAAACFYGLYRMRNVLGDERLQTGSALGYRALPTTLFFDARGQLVSTHIGELSQATLAQRLSELRGATPPDKLFTSHGSTP